MTRRELLAAAIGAAATAALLLGAERLGGRAPARDLSTRGAPGAEDATAATVATATDDEAWRTANANLVRTVQQTQERLDRNEAEKKALARELKEAKATLAAAERDGAPARSEFDLTQADWRELAKTGTVKARYPCHLDPEWHMTRDQASALGLTGTEAATVETAITNEADRIASAIMPGCAKVLGNPELARRLGTEVCTAVVTESVKDQGPDLHLVASIEAGDVPTPPPEALNPFATMMLAQATSTQALEADLRKALGPDVAHRVTFADELGSCSGTSGGTPPPR